MYCPSIFSVTTFRFQHRFLQEPVCTMKGMAAQAKSGSLTNSRNGASNFIEFCAGKQKCMTLPPCGNGSQTTSSQSLRSSTYPYPPTPSPAIISLTTFARWQHRKITSFSRSTLTTTKSSFPWFNKLLIPENFTYWSMRFFVCTIPLVDFLNAAFWLLPTIEALGYSCTFCFFCVYTFFLNSYFGSIM